MKMELIDYINNWKNMKVLVIGEALIDKYIIGDVNGISPDAPIQNVKIEETLTYLGGIGRIIQFIKSLGGIPEICTQLNKNKDLKL